MNINALIPILKESLSIHLTGVFDPRTPSDVYNYPCPYMAGKAIALNKNLELLCCLEDEKEWNIGKVNLKSKDIKINHKKIINIQRRKMLAFNKCGKCPAKCGGGCTHLSYLKYGTLSVPGDYKKKCDALQNILATYLKLKLLGND
ncbi:MAG: hypothetical protein ACFFD2_06130 [Promethearchaeota archaeon]